MYHIVIGRTGTPSPIMSEEEYRKYSTLRPYWREVEEADVEHETLDAARTASDAAVAEWTAANERFMEAG